LGKIAHCFFPKNDSNTISLFACAFKKYRKMKQRLLIDSVSNAGVLKYEITAEDLMKVVMDIIRETTKSILTKYDEERSPDFIPRKEAVEKFELKIPLTCPDLIT
jgi:hypothetical protein